MFNTILLWSHLVLGFCFLGDFFITTSILVLVIGWFIISISSWFSLRRLTFFKNLSISSRLSILLHLVVHNSLIILCISALSVVTSLFSFLILLIWFFFLFFLMGLAKGLSILFIFSKNQLLVSLIFAFVLFVSISFSFAWIFMISFLF